jgi:hypothetical protein
MKKIIVFGLALFLITALGSVTPAGANNNFWPGVAVGVGSAIILSQIANASARPYYGPGPAYVPGPPPPPVYRERVIVRGYPGYIPYGYYRPHPHWHHHYRY